MKALCSKIPITAMCQLLHVPIQQKSSGRQGAPTHHCCAHIWTNRPLHCNPIPIYSEGRPIKSNGTSCHVSKYRISAINVITVYCLPFPYCCCLCFLIILILKKQVIWSITLQLKYFNRTAVQNLKQLSSPCLMEGLPLFYLAANAINNYNIIVLFLVLHIF